MAWRNKIDKQRKYNIIIMGVPESRDHSEDERFVRNMLHHIRCDRAERCITNIARLGRYIHGKRRLIKVDFNDVRAARDALDNSSFLAGPWYGHIYIKTDRTFAEREKVGSNMTLHQAAGGANGGTWGRTRVADPNTGAVTKGISVAAKMENIQTRDRGTNRGGKPQGDRKVLGEEITQESIGDLITWGRYTLTEEVAADVRSSGENGGAVGRGDGIPRNELKENSRQTNTPKRNSEGGPGMMKRGLLLLTSPFTGYRSTAKTEKSGDSGEVQKGAAEAGAMDTGVEAGDVTASGATANGSGRVDEQTAAKGTGGGANRDDRDSTSEQGDIFDKEPRTNCG